MTDEPDQETKKAGPRQRIPAFGGSSNRAVNAESKHPRRGEDSHVGRLPRNPSTQNPRPPFGDRG
jgi:hypothetical protein